MCQFPFTIIVENQANFEQAWTRIQLLDRSIFVGAVYVPPNSEAEAYNQVVKSTKGVLDIADPADYLFVGGDLNCVADWFPDIDNPRVLRFTNASPNDTAFLDEMASLGLVQVCGVHSHNQLELIFTDIDCDVAVTRASHPLKQDSHHHVAIECAFAVRTQMPESDENPKQFNFYKANLPALAVAMSAVDWSNELRDQYKR